MTISPAPLPYTSDALDPCISARTLDLHYNKHYLGYIRNLKELIRDTQLAEGALPEIVRAAWKAGNLPVFNNAAQAWNHEFYFASLSPTSIVPTGPIGSLIERDFGTVERLLEVLTTSATAHFGSGWVWLVLDGGKLNVVSTANADSPLLYARQVPLLAIDVWEHAYYLDYQNERRRYIEAVTARLLNWNIANQRLSNSQKSGRQRRTKMPGFAALAPDPGPSTAKAIE
ncbi:MAG: superoxide dismutase [Pseudomonadales bacterium]